MNNVLLSAISAISNTYPSSLITIKKQSSEIINGVDFKKEVSITTIASVQMLKGSEVVAGVTYSNANDYRRFYILGSDIHLVSSALKHDYINSKIMFENRLYNVYYKEDWSLNGWLICDAVCSKDLE